MSSGLYIEHKKDYHIGRWLFLLIFAFMIATAGWFGYKWFTTGDVPPLVPMPAAALADPSVDESKVTLAAINEYTVPADHPRYISIPALNVEKARVQTVGLTKNNTLDTPKNISDTAWYNKSALPGSGYGSVLIDGHNGGISHDGVFAKLNTLKKDDQIIIERGDGKKITYSIVENQTESLQDANTTGMKRLMTPFTSGQEGLGLITCAGNWVPRDKVFDKRVLIRAVAL
jgi:LPXTG-site transpeptidase (sortase) family protein